MDEEDRRGSGEVIEMLRPHGSRRGGTFTHIDTPPLDDVEENISSAVAPRSLPRVSPVSPAAVPGWPAPGAASLDAAAPEPASSAHGWPEAMADDAGVGVPAMDAQIELAAEPPISVSDTAEPDADEFGGMLRRAHAIITQHGELQRSHETGRVERLKADLEAMEGRPDAAPQGQQQGRANLIAGLAMMMGRSRDLRRRNEIECRLRAAEQRHANIATRDSVLTGRLNAMVESRRALQARAAQAAAAVDRVNTDFQATRHGQSLANATQAVAMALGDSEESIDRRVANPKDQDMYIQALRKQREDIFADPAMARFKTQAAAANAAFEAALGEANALRDGVDFLSRNNVDVSAFRQLDQVVARDLEEVARKRSLFLQDQKPFQDRVAETVERIRKEIALLIERAIRMVQRLVGGNRPVPRPGFTSAL